MPCGSKLMLHTKLPASQARPSNPRTQKEFKTMWWVGGCREAACDRTITLKEACAVHAEVFAGTTGGESSRAAVCAKVVARHVKAS